MSLFGKAKYSGKSRNWFKLKDGDGTYRILPPMGELAEDGRWSAFYKIHYGYKNSVGEMRTFQSPLLVNRKTKMMEVPDAAYDRIQQLTAKLDEAKKAGNGPMVEQLLKLVGGKKSRYNLDNNHYMNVVDLQGNVGILKIRHRAKLALDAQIKKMRDNGTDPLDAETGRFFTFSRSGMGMDTIYQVTIYKKKITVANVGEVEQEVVHAIDADLARRCLVQNKDGSLTYKEAANLATLFKAPTAEEVQRIVNEGEKAVDEILDAKAASGDFSEDTSGLEGEEAPTVVSNNLQPTGGTTAPTAVQTTGFVSTTPAPTPVAAAPVVQETIQAVASFAAPAVKAAAPKTTAQAVADQSDEDFLASLGIKS